MDANFKSPYFVLSMLAVFGISFSIMWRQRKADDVPAPRSPPLAAVGEPERPPAAAVPASSPPYDERITFVAHPSDAPQRVPTEASAEGSGNRRWAQPMPVSIQVWNRANRHRIDGTVQNLSPSTMTVTARVENSTTKAITEFDLVIEPQETKSFSTETGLDIHANDQITFTSPPYADQSETVPP